MSPHSFQYFRKKFNFKVLTHQEWVERALKAISVILMVAALVCIVCEHGFYLSEMDERFVTGIVTAAFIFYIVKFIIRLFFADDIVKYLKNNKLEIISILVIILSYLITGIREHHMTGLGYVQMCHRHVLMFHALYFVILFIELAKISTIFKKINLSPPLLMLFSFLILISLGTVLLLLPKMTTNGISFIDALFTATSASCVTGLTVLETGTTFTQNGHIILMLLVQMGGMSILSFATFFISFLSHSYTGLRYQYLVKDMLSTDKVADSYSFLREIVLTIFIIEGAGVILLYMYWNTTGLFSTNSETLFYAVFHAISAFNNAGFSLWSNNLMNGAIINSYFPQAILMILVFLGSIGFVVLRDFFDPKVIRERKKKRWQRLTPGTQIALITTFVIIIIGTLLFFILEYNNSLASRGNVFDKLFCSLTQVVLGRTAGFNIVDVESISMPMIMIFIMIIFIGASPGSTGGGIKTTTAFVIVKSIFATIKGKNKIEFHKKTIPFQIVDKAYSIVVMSFVLIFISTVVLAIFEPTVPLKNILFESTSAFTTCGMSTGCISDFTAIGKLILTINMYIGRIGTLTFAYALSKRTKETRHEYPETYFMVG